jgi:Ca2+-binding RTX toxin-like protein
MWTGTSPSINDRGDVAFQDDTGNVYTYYGTGNTNWHLGMMAGTSPSIIYTLGASRRTKFSRVIHGGPGNDRLDGGPRSDLIFGGRGNDTIHAAPGNDRIDGGRGNDRIYTGRGNDTIYAGPGNDHSYGGRGNDLISGGRGNDTIYGGAGNDFIDASKPGHTTVFPGSGTNWVNLVDRHRDDRAVCTSGSVNYIHADRGDHIARSCRGKGSISYVGVR